MAKKTRSSARPPKPRTPSPDELGVVRDFRPTIRRVREHLEGCPKSNADKEVVDIINALNVLLDDSDLDRPLPRERVRLLTCGRTPRCGPWHRLKCPRQSDVVVLVDHANRGEHRCYLSAVVVLDLDAAELLVRGHVCTRDTLRIARRPRC